MSYFRDFFDSVGQEVINSIENSLENHKQKLKQFEETVTELGVFINDLGNEVDLRELWKAISLHIDILKELSEKNVLPELSLSGLFDSALTAFNSGLDSFSEKEKTYFLLRFKNERIAKFESSGNWTKFIHNQFHYNCYYRVFNFDDKLKNYLKAAFFLKFMTISEKMLNESVRMEADHFEELHKKFEIFQDSTMFFDNFAKSVRSGVSTRKEVFDKFEEYRGIFGLFYKEIDEKKSSICDFLRNAVEISVGNVAAKAYFMNSPVVSSLYFGEDSLAYKTNSLKKNFLSNDGQFSNHFTTEKSDWNKDIEISEYQIFLGNLAIETQELVENKFFEKYEPAFRRINDILEDSVKRLAGLETDDLQKTKMTILKDARNIQKVLRDDFIPEILEISQKSGIHSVCKNVLQRIDDAIERIDQLHSIFRSVKVRNNVTVSKSVQIPFRELIKYKTHSALNRKYSIFLDEIKRLNEKIVRRVGEIEKIVEYNLDAALSVMRNRPDTDGAAAEKAVSIATEGLERALNLSNELLSVTATAVEKVRTSVPQMFSEYLNALEELTFSEKVIELNLYLVRKRTVRNLKNTFNIVRDFSNKTLPELVKIAADYFYGAKRNYSKFKKITGLAGSNNEESSFLYLEKLNEMEQKIGKMPYVYQRLFSSESLPDRTFYVERQEVPRQFAEDFAYWKKGGSISAIVVGEKGCGKTTFSEILQSSIFKEHRVFRAKINTTTYKINELFEILKESFDMPDVVDIDMLESRVASSESRKIFMLENFQNLYLRTMDGFEAVERFLLFMERTQKKVFWIVSCNLYAWNYIDLATSASAYFQRIILIKGLNGQGIEELIMKRHNSSGYELEFEIPEDVRVKKKIARIKNPDDVQNFMQKYYFDKLTRLSAGNIKSALLMWLGSVSGITQEKITMSAEMLADNPFIADLPREEKFALTAVIMHDTLNIRDYAAISRTSENEAGMLLLRLYNKGLLIRNGDNFQIHPFVYRDVVRVLKSLNMLH